jgi:6-phosphogluconolactonase (cycloisomerase 2 family)
MQQVAQIERVYVLSNAAAGNAVSVWTTAPDGTLVPLGAVVPLVGLPAGYGPAGGYHPVPAFPTGGLGTGDVLVSQGALALDQSRRFLYAVNPGSDDVSAFAVTPTGLRLLGRVGSGGVEPRSLAVHGDLLYVVNGFGHGHIAGFRLGPNGLPVPLAGSVRPLGSPDSGPAQVSFTADGRALVVSELFADRISVFPVGPDGLPGEPSENPSAGDTPFGFGISRSGLLVVSESARFRPGESAVSSYRLTGGKLRPVSRSIGTAQTATCWVAITPDGRYAYTTNTGSGTITGYRITAKGTLTPLSRDGRTAVTGAVSLPVDVVISGDGQVLHVLAQGRQAIVSFRIGSDGQLTPAPVSGGVPPLAVGMAIG